MTLDQIRVYFSIPKAIVENIHRKIYTGLKIGNKRQQKENIKTRKIMFELTNLGQFSATSVLQKDRVRYFGIL